MPIGVKDYSWNQTDSMVFVSVPLKGVIAKKVDILTTDDYIKVNFTPYFFECFLAAPVFNLQTVVQIGNGEVVFKLNKQDAKVWDQLQNPDSENKEKQKILREEALNKYREQEEEMKKKKSELKHELGRFSVKEQMKLEDENRKWIEDVKNNERKIATEDLEKWKIQQKAMSDEVKQKTEHSSNQPAKASTETNSKFHSRSNKNQKNIFQNQAGDAPLRETGKISINFTPRYFPTPQRESLAPEEDAWLKKQAEVRRIIELEDENLAEEERNPVWLRDKGNSFFKAGNYQAAINAYTHAIRLNCKMPSLYSNRAACNLKLNNCFKCLEDCSKALELLVPPVPQNKDSRYKAHIRRGTAFCQLEMYVEGLQDYEAALKLDPDNDALRADAEKIRQIVQGSKIDSVHINIPKSEEAIIN